MLRKQDCTYSAFFIPVTTVFNIPLTSWNWVTITDLVAGDSLKVPRAIPLQHGHPLRAQLVILCSQPLLLILRPLVRFRAPCQGAIRYSSTFRRSILPLLLYRALLLQQHALAPSSLTPAHAAAAIIYTTDIVSTFCTGLVIVNSLRQAVVMDRKMVAVRSLMPP